MMLLRLIAAHVRANILALLRSPTYWVPTLLFPTMLYLFFGLPASYDDPQYGRSIMASFAAYGVVGVAFYQFGVGIAQDREGTWEVFLRILPSSASPRIIARVVVALLFATGAAGLVIAVAHTFSSPDLLAGQVFALALVLAFGAVPFALLGVALGYWTRAKAAIPIANLIFLPLAYVGGLWIPPQRLPDVVGKISLFTPTRHFGEVVWAAALGKFPTIENWSWLAFYTLLFGAFALWGYRRDEGARYR